MPDRPEARIPCPVCGGAIHPVAGRCKHCKTDLAALRTGRPQAAASLPSLGNRTVNERAVAGPRSVARGHAGPRAMPKVDPTTATFSISSQLPSQMLPPRPTGRMFAVAPGMPIWPIVVIALSSLATITSIAVIVGS